MTDRRPQPGCRSTRRTPAVQVIALVLMTALSERLWAQEGGPPDADTRALRTVTNAIAVIRADPSSPEAGRAFRSILRALWDLRTPDWRQPLPKSGVDLEQELTLLGIGFVATLDESGRQALAREVIKPAMKRLESADPSVTTDSPVRRLLERISNELTSASAPSETTPMEFWRQTASALDRLTGSLSGWISSPLTFERAAGEARHDLVTLLSHDGSARIDALMRLLHVGSLGQRELSQLADRLIGAMETRSVPPFNHQITADPGGETPRRPLWFALAQVLAERLHDAHQRQQLQRRLTLLETGNPRGALGSGSPAPVTRAVPPNLRATLDRIEALVAREAPDATIRDDALPLVKLLRKALASGRFGAVERELHDRLLAQVRRHVRSLEVESQRLAALHEAWTGLDQQLSEEPTGPSTRSEVESTSAVATPQVDSRTTERSTDSSSSQAAGEVGLPAVGLVARQEPPSVMKPARSGQPTSDSLHWGFHSLELLTMLVFLRRQGRATELDRIARLEAGLRRELIALFRTAPVLALVELEPPLASDGLGKLIGRLRKAWTRLDAEPGSTLDGSGLTRSEVCHLLHEVNNFRNRIVHPQAADGRTPLQKHERRHLRSNLDALDRWLRAWRSRQNPAPLPVARGRRRDTRVP